MIKLRYGSGETSAPYAPGGRPWLVGDEPPPLSNARAALEGALRRPLGAQALARFVEPGDRVAVVRQRGLPADAASSVSAAILEAVEEAGASEVVVLEAAGGSAGSSESPDLETVATGGAAVAAAEGLGGFVALGRTKELGVVRVRAELARADKLVLVGSGAFDPLAGHAGGGLLVALGCAEPATAEELLRASLLPSGGLHPLARPGTLEGNPVQAAAGQLLALAPPAFLVQLEFQRGRRLAGVFAGDPELAFSASCDFHSKWHSLRLDHPFDLAIASAGGDPDDRDLTRALPALAAAFAAVREGGEVVFLAACPEGAGALERIPDPEGGPLLARILEGLGGGKRCTLVSEGISADAAAALGIGHSGAASAAIEVATRRYGEGRVALLEGSGLLPIAPG